MSGFLVIVERKQTGRPPPVPPAVVAELRRYPFDAFAGCEGPGFAALQSSRWYRPQDRASRWPWSGDLGGPLLVCGGTRLDNTKALAARLGQPASVTEAEIVAHAYRAFQDDFPLELLGDFGLVLYDQRRQALLIVRDHLGICPLYYHVSESFCLVSDRIDLLLAHPAVPHDADALTSRNWTVDGHAWDGRHTFFEAIRKCPAASLICIDAQGAREQHYWSAANVSPLPRDSIDGHARRLRGLIETAIADRTESIGPLGAHCSGGLDCSPIAIIAGRRSRTLGQPFFTYNWCKPDEGDDPGHHEWAHARRVAAAEGFEHAEIGARPQEFLHALLHHDPSRDGSEVIVYERPLLALARSQGVCQILTGFGGDEAISQRSRDTHTAALRQGRLLHVLRRLAAEVDPARRLHALRIALNFARLLRSTLRPPVKTESKDALDLRRSRMKLFRPPPAEGVRSGEDWLAAYAGSASVRERQELMLNLGYHQDRIETWACHGARAGVRYLYPYLDKRIVEFALGLPGEYYFRHGINRFLYRQSLGDVLPPYLLNKQKLAESRRVEQWVEAACTAFADPRIRQRVAAARSSSVDTDALLQRLASLGSPSPGASRERMNDAMIALQAVVSLSLPAG